MVLAELGLKIASALKKLNTATVIDEAILSEILKDIGNALLAADVNLTQVIKLRENVRTQVKMMQTGSSAANLRRVIQRVQAVSNRAE
jgi:signal recognition particle subunit SRP54